MKNAISIICLMLLIYSCYGQKGEKFDNAKVRINIDTLQIQKNVYFTDMFDSYEVIPLETNSESLIGKIDEIDFYNDTIIVLDRKITKSVFLYDINGKFIRKIGKLGKGPGEYVKPISMAFNHEEQQIIILCQSLKKVIFYSMKGEFINEFRIKSSGLLNRIAYNNDNIYIDIHPNKSNDSYLLYTYNKSGEFNDKWLLNNAHRNGFAQPFNFSSVFFSSGDEVKYFKPFMNVVFQLKSNTYVSIFVFRNKKQSFNNRN